MKKKEKVTPAEFKLLEILWANSPLSAGQIFDALVNKGDHYLLLADYASYMAAQDEVDRVYQDQDEWTRRAVLNVARIGKFSSDRTIGEYAKNIWKVKPVDH